MTGAHLRVASYTREHRCAGSPGPSPGAQMAESIQQRLYPHATCFGCGQANPDGLQLQSFATGDDIVATFQAWPQHDNGLGYLNGGIIATVLDCHSGAAAFHVADAHGWQPIGDLPFPFVTSGLDIRYRRPSPLTEPCTLHAHVTSASEDVMQVEAELMWDDKVCATAASEWRRWRPRA